MTIAAVAAIAATAGCGGGRGGGPGPVGARATTRAPVMAWVPADARMVFHVPAGLDQMMPADAGGDGDGPDDDDVDGLRATSPAGPVLAAFFAAGGNDLPGMMRAYGWRPGESEAVVWARGTMGVVRTRLDTAALRASLARAEQASGHTLPTATWRGRSYYRLYDGEGAQPTRLIGRVTDDDLVLMWTRDVERDLPALMEDRPPARGFDGAPVVDTIFPGHGDEAHFALMIDPRWPGEIAAELDASGAAQPCGRASLAMLARLPPIHLAWARSATTVEVAATVALEHATGARLERELTALPHWSADERQLALGFGLPLTTALDVVMPWVGELERVAGACGQPLTLAPVLGGLTGFGPLAAIRSGSMIIDVQSESGVIVVGLDDVARFWAGLRTLGPLRPQPPLVGERIRLPGAVITSDGSALLVATGDRLDERQLDRVAALPPGPRVVVAMLLGEDGLTALAREDGDDPGAARLLGWIKAMALDASVRDDHLIVRWVFHRR